MLKKSPEKVKKSRFGFMFVTGIILLVISNTVSIIGGYAFHYIYKLGFVNDKNSFIFWLAIIIILFIGAGGLLNLALAVIFTSKTDTLSKAMQKIIDGEFSARINYTGKLTDPGKKAVDSFNEMAVQLKNTKMLNNDFISNFSHDIRTPLGNITGFANLIKSNTLTEEERNEYIDIIIEEARRLSRLSENILMLLRFENDKKIINIQSINLTEQLRQISASLYHKWNEKNVEIILDSSDISVTASRDLLAQVWINLLDNAIKFSPAGKSVHISITKNADLVSVSIKNYGCTLSEAELPLIFERFYQKETTQKAAGNGLGLALVKSITELHGGTVFAELCGDGTIIFTVSLPLSQ